MTTSKQCCNVPAELRKWVMEVLQPCGIESRVHYLQVPEPCRRGNVCYIEKPYVCYSRNGIENEDCLGTVAHPDVLEIAGYEPDRGNDKETFDIEIWGEDAIEIECYARTLVESAPHQGKLGDIWAQYLNITDQADDYIHKGLHQSYSEGGATAASFQIDLCPICIRKFALVASK